MDLEHLNKTQIILLTLLVSFVTSIATGIVTITLLDQAPPGVTNTISKVVERTVERVVPAKSQGASVVKTVIIKENDLISKAVEKNKKSLVSIFIEKGINTKKDIKTDGDKKIKNQFVAVGFFASPDGLIITDSALVSNDGKYKVKIYNGDELNVKVVKQDEEKRIAILKVVPQAPSEKNKDDKKDKIQKQIFPAVVFANSNDTRLGQTVVLLSGVENTTVLTGIISSFDTKSFTKEIKSDDPKDKNKKTITKTIKYRSSINTNIFTSKTKSGSPSLNTDGGTIGMSLINDGMSYTVPSNLIIDIITELEKSETKAESSKNNTVSK